MPSVVSEGFQALVVVVSEVGVGRGVGFFSLGGGGVVVVLAAVRARGALIASSSAGASGSLTG